MVELGHTVWWPDWVSACLPEGAKGQVAGAGAGVARAGGGKGAIKRARSASVGRGGLDPEASIGRAGTGRQEEGGGCREGKGRND